MTFKDWWTQRETATGCALNGADNASAAWGYQQQRIDDLEAIVKSAYMDGWHAGYKDAENDIPVAEYEPPKGYVVVPVEPVDTVDKIDNIITLLKSSEYNGADLMTAWIMLKRYKAMIQAAQEEE